MNIKFLQSILVVLPSPIFSASTIIQGNKEKHAFTSPFVPDTNILSRSRTRTQTQSFSVMMVHSQNLTLAVPGSPNNNTLISPRIRCLSLIFLGTPPNKLNAIAILTCSCP